MGPVKQVDVLGVRVEMPTNKPILLLRERDGERYVPIWIGAPEATAIAYAQQGVTPPRPLTHDLLLDILTALGHELSSVMITRMEEGVFYAELVIDGDQRISARSSDAVAVALRAEVPVFVDEEVLAEVGVDVPVEEEDEVERFREFLDNVSAEDFEVGDEGSEGS